MTASMPAFEDLAAYEQAIHEQAPWMGALAHIGTQTALDVISELSVMTCCRSPVLGSRDHVVKLYPRAWLPTRSKYLDEVAAYEVLARDPDLPVPRLLAHGAIDGGADYIVLSRIHGRQLTAIMADLAAAELEGIAAWSGRYLRRLHALRLTPDERDRGHAALAARIDRSTVLERLASLRAMPDRLLAEVEGWLPEFPTSSVMLVRPASSTTGSNPSTSSWSGNTATGSATAWSTSTG